MAFPLQPRARWTIDRDWAGVFRCSTGTNTLHHGSTRIAHARSISSCILKMGGESAWWILIFLQKSDSTFSIPLQYRNDSSLCRSQWFRYVSSPGPTLQSTNLPKLALPKDHKPKVEDVLEVYEHEPTHAMAQA